MTLQQLRIATRKSPLALRQSELVKQALEQHYPELTVTLVPMSTQGDRMLDVSLNKIGGKGLFTKELEKSLLAGETDIAVHSMKDMPALIPPVFAFPAVLPREDASDAFVSANYAGWDDLPQAARVGTSSLRRQSQLLAYRPDLTVVPLRGNVNTRLQKSAAGDLDAIILAAAGLKRLGLGEHIRARMAHEVCLPAVAQGIIGIQCLRAATSVIDYLAPLNHLATAQRMLAERSMNQVLGGSCQTPIAGHATLHDGMIQLTGLVAEPDGQAVIQESAQAPAAQAEQLGTEVAQRLLTRGADVIIQKCLANAH